MRCSASYLDIAATGGVVGMLMGALGSALHGGTIDDILAGAVGGGVAGLVGAPAFAFLSGAGVLGCMVAGGTAGVAGGFVESYGRNRDLEAAWTEAFASGIVSIVTGGLFGGADRIAGIGATSRLMRVWNMEDKLRGRIIHAADGLPRDQGGLHPDFPGIDEILGGIARSKKSIDLRKPSYREGRGLLYKVRTYIRRLSRFNGGALAGDVVEPGDIARRELEVIVPPGVMTPAQRALLDECRLYGEREVVPPVTVTLREWPP